MGNPVEYGVEIAGNEYATVLLSSSSSMDLEVSVEAVTSTTLLPDVTVVEVAFTSFLGWLNPPSYTTVARPSANSVPATSPYYDLTLHKPAWSDGTNWRDASGVII